MGCLRIKLIHAEHVAESWHLFNFGIGTDPETKAFKFLLEWQDTLTLVPGAISDQPLLPWD